MFDFTNIVTPISLDSILIGLLWTAMFAGVYITQLRGAMKQLKEQDGDINNLRLEIAELQKDLLRNYVARETIDGLLRPLNIRLDTLHSEIAEIRSILLRRGSVE